MNKEDIQKCKEGTRLLRDHKTLDFMVDETFIQEFSPSKERVKLDVWHNIDYLLETHDIEVLPLIKKMDKDIETREVSGLRFGLTDTPECKKVYRKWYQFWKPKYRWVSDSWETKPTKTKTWTDEN